MIQPGEEQRSEECSAIEHVEQGECDRSMRGIDEYQVDAACDEGERKK